MKKAMQINQLYQDVTRNIIPVLDACQNDELEAERQLADAGDKVREE